MIELWSKMDLLSTNLKLTKIIIINNYELNS